MSYQMEMLVEETKNGWSGDNKEITREKKAAFVEKYRGNNIGLTLPGAEARFERLLLDKGISAPSDIVGIQQKNPAHVLKRLKQVGKEIGIGVWGTSLEEMVNVIEVYRSEDKDSPFIGKHPPLVDQHIKTFSEGIGFFDLDLMSSVSHKTFHILKRILECGLPAKKSAIMLNIVKGRYKGVMRRKVDSDGVKVQLIGGDVGFRGQSIRIEMAKVLWDAGAIQAAFCSIGTHFPVKGKPRPTMAQMEEFHKKLNEEAPLQPYADDIEKALFFFMVVPTYCSCIAASQGYRLKLRGMIEYRDKNQSSGKASTMVQHLFSCTKAADKESAMDVVYYNQQRAKAAVAREWTASVLNDQYDEGGLYTKFVD